MNKLLQTLIRIVVHFQVFKNAAKAFHHVVVELLLFKGINLREPV